MSTRTRSTVDLRDGRLIVGCRDAGAVIAAVRRLPAAKRYNPADRTWAIEATAAATFALGALLDDVLADAELTAAARQALAPRSWLDVADRDFELELAPRHPALTAVRAIDGRRWQRRTKRWTIPARRDSAPAVYRLCAEHAVASSAEAARRLDLLTLPLTADQLAALALLERAVRAHRAARPGKRPAVPISELARLRHPEPPASRGEREHRHRSLAQILAHLRDHDRGRLVDYDPLPGGDRGWWVTRDGRDAHGA